jgi:hypothetical protein
MDGHFEFFPKFVETFASHGAPPVSGINDLELRKSKGIFEKKRNIPKEIQGRGLAETDT